MQLNKTYTRISPKGDKSEVTIKTQEQLEYHRDLEAHGFEYKVKPTIHVSNSTCVSCEG